MIGRTVIEQKRSCRGVIRESIRRSVSNLSKLLIVPAVTLTLPPINVLAQLYTEKPIPSPGGQVTAVNLFHSTVDSIQWVAVADSFMGMMYGDEIYKNILYCGSPSSTAQRLFILDSSVTVWAYYGGYYDLYNCSIADNSADRIAVAWVKQLYSWSDIAYPRLFGAPQLQCAVRSVDSFEKILQIERADHATILFDDQDLIHVVYESVTPFSSSALYPPFIDTSYYFVTSRLEYRRLHADGRLDSVADFSEGFRPQLHRDMSGTFHLFWLKGDSSNCPEFQLMYTRNPGTAGEITLEVPHPLRAVEEYDLNRYPPSFSSFIDDSGRASVGWTDFADYSDGRIYFVRLSSDSSWGLDTRGGLALWHSPASFNVDFSGKAHVLWMTYDGSRWHLHYSTCSTTERLFAQQRTFQSPDPYAWSPVIVIDSRGVANTVFSDGISGIGYLRDLESGPDTTIYVSPGSSIARPIAGFPSADPRESSVAIDGRDQLWVVRDNNGLALLRFDRTLTGQGEIGTDRPAGFSLKQNFPNPFNPVTTIQFSIVNSQYTILKVYDLLGREVAVLVNEKKAPGSYEVSFDATGLASGVYIYRLTAGSFVQTRKMLVLR
jgi:Secretion system C-terminal sorting domain